MKSSKPGFKRAVGAGVATGLAAFGGVLVANKAGAATPEASAFTTQSRISPELIGLARVIIDLDKGEIAEVPQDPIDVVGAIDVAVGQPLVFSIGRTTYLAYTLDKSLNLNESPLNVASGMHIEQEPATDANIPLVPAYIDKAGGLVDTFGDPVGFAISVDAGK